MSKKEEVITKEKISKRYKVGIASRVNKPLTIYYEDSTFILSPGGRTKKEFSTDSNSGNVC